MQYASLTRPSWSANGLVFSTKYVHEEYLQLYEAIKKLPGADYFIQNNPDDYRPEKFVHSRLDYARCNPGVISKEYNHFVSKFMNGSSLDHRLFAIGAKKMTKNMMKFYCDFPDDEEISSSSLSRATSTLGSSSLDGMRDEYAENYESVGAPFRLPSGKSFDAVIYQHVMEVLKKQSPLHSSILDSNYRKEPPNLLPDNSDSETFANRLDELVKLVSLKHRIPDWQMDVINRFTSIKSIKEALFKGLDTVFTIEGIAQDGFRNLLK
ncbi:hypothetical protein BGX27_002378 [Mortierella sp. AM989]|nr:hypothetical protein BGX27_002378 [Mortierella sp. AM989]